MAIYLVELSYNVDRNGREQTNPAHVEYLRELSTDGVLKLGGPVVGENSGLLLYEAADRSELDGILAAEPYVLAGLVSSTTIREWQPGKGQWAPHSAEAGLGTAGASKAGALS